MKFPTHSTLTDVAQGQVIAVNRVVSDVKTAFPHRRGRLVHISKVQFRYLNTDGSAVNEEGQ